MDNTITQGRDRELAPDGNGEIRRAPTPASVDLKSEVLDASRLKEAGRGDAMRQRSSIESRTDLRLAATNEAMRADPTRSAGSVVVEQETARRWADLDANDFGRIRSDARRETAVEAIAGHVRFSAEYADELKKRSPPLADAARALNEERGKIERQAALQAADQQRQTNVAAAAQTRQSLVEAAALATLASIRAKETARVAEQLATTPDASTQEPRNAHPQVKPPPLSTSATTPSDPDQVAQAGRTIKRPVIEDELSQALRTRYIVAQQKSGLFDRASTEFTIRSGEEQGRVAFVDVGKSLSTQREDKATIRAMVEVATTKNWQELTVSGTDEFRRNAWIEASLNSIKVRGYEPRETDRQLLADLQQRDKLANLVTAVERQTHRDSSRVSVRSDAKPDLQPKHIDGDALTSHEKSVLDNSRAILDSKAMGAQFTEATLRELESRLRGERVYIGEIVKFGPARYQFDKANDESYFVALKTPAGTQVIWGKDLIMAMQGRSAGESVVLMNVGKRDVTVQETVRDVQGQVLEHRPKETQYNAWRSELLSRFNEKALSDFLSRSHRRDPSLMAYDIKAPRQPERATSPEQINKQHRVAQQRSPRER